MNTFKLSNISLAQMRLLLKNCKCTCARTSGGHEMWVRGDLGRPITLQNHIDPVPEFIVKQICKHLGISKKQVHELIHKKK